MLALFGPLAFNIRTPRCEVSVLGFQGHRRAKSAGEIRALRAQDAYTCSALVSFRMESRTLTGHNLILRRLSEGPPPKGLKTDEQKFRSLRAPDILV
jgi:hypothetical protein